MNRLPKIVLSTVLIATATAALVSVPGTAQDAESDLAVVDVSVEDAVYDAPHPANVTVTVLNNGTNDASGIAHFRYDDANTSLTNDTRSDQPFNTTDPLGPGETVDVTIRWRPSLDKIGEGEVIGYVSGSDERPENDRGSQSVFVERYALNATVDEDPPPITLPGRTTGFRVILENTGNAPLTPVAEVARDAPRTWRAEAPAVPVTLEPGESTSAYALVTPPDEDEEDLPDGSKAGAEIEWFARENPPGNATVELPNTTVDREPPEPYQYGAAVEAADEVLPVNTQATGRTTVDVINTGNVADVFTVDVKAEGDLASNLTASVGRNLVVVPANTSVEVPLEVELSGEPRTSWRANVTVQAASVNERLEPEARNATSVEVRVASPDLDIDPPSWGAPVYAADDTVSVRVPVTNVGQGPVAETRLVLGAFRGGFPFATAETSVPRLDPGTSTNVSLDVAVGNLSGSYELRATADADDAIEEPVEEDNEESRQLFVRTAKLSVEPAEGLEALPGQFVRYERPPHVFYVQNRGNSEEEVAVEIESEPGWIKESQQLTLKEGAREPVAFSFDVPEKPGTQTDELRVTASLLKRSSVEAGATTSTRILDSEPPRLLGVDVPENVTATEPFPVRTNWTDAIGLANATLVLVSPSNSTTEVPLTGASPGVWRANATVFELGTYHVRFRATDASDRANVFVQDRPLSVSSTYEQSPTITFLGDLATRAGDPIPVEVHDSAGLASVRYEAAGASGELSAPFEVPTDEWRSGEHTVTVVAENRFGLVAEAQANVTVDNSPPSIDAVTLQPDDPRASETLTVEVEATDDPARGHPELLGKRGDVLLESNLTAEPTEGRFTASLTVPEGATKARVVLEDAVGNRATHEVALGGADLPSPGAVAALASTCLGAVLARGRGSRP